MIVQVISSNGQSGNCFGLQIPGSGWGSSPNACATQFNVSSGWGVSNGGISSRSACALLPAVLQSGCYWRFDWLLDIQNPNVTFQDVPCPSALTSITGCQRLWENQPRGDSSLHDEGPNTWSSVSNKMRPHYPTERGSPLYRMLSTLSISGCVTGSASEWLIDVQYSAELVLQEGYRIVDIHSRTLGVKVYSSFFKIMIQISRISLASCVFLRVSNAKAYGATISTGK